MTVDDHPIYRGGLASLIAAYRDLTLVAEAANGREAVERFTFDVRWKYAAGGLDFEHPGFVHTVLVDMRERLRRSERPDRIFEAVLDVAKAAGLVGRKRVLDSTAWKWEDMAVRKTDVGERRDVVQQPTRTLDELEMHITTLNPRTTSHPPHTHPNEEMVIVREGTLQAHVNGKEVVVGPGGVLFYASMQPHGVKNIGDTPATYFVINWSSPGSKKKEIPTPPSGPSAQ